MPDLPRCDFGCYACEQDKVQIRFNEALAAMVELVPHLWNFGDGRGAAVIVDIERAITKAVAEAGLPLPRLKIRPATLVDVIGERDGWHCVYCAKPLQPTLPHPEIDHVIPKSKGGTDDLDNLVLACSPCNSSKGAKDLADWKRA